MNFNHGPAYEEGLLILGVVEWLPRPSEMFKAPSRAKGGPLHKAAAKTVADPLKIDQFMNQAILAARIEHFIAIGGVMAREYFLGNKCRLDAKKIARLSRRMPPFVLAKLDDLYAGSKNVDSNPTGAFDTNGWAELRVRLPKFAAVVHRYAQQQAPTENTVDFTKIGTLLSEIRRECTAMYVHLKTFSAQGDGKEVRAPQALDRKLEWIKAPMRLAQVLGVLRKCNRDLRSPQWKEEWEATVGDLNTLNCLLKAMKQAAAEMEKRIP